MGRVLLVDGEEHLLLGRVARLDDVARPIDIRGEPIGDGDDERQPAGAQALDEGTDVEQHRVAGTGFTDHCQIGQGTHLTRQSGGVLGGQPHGILHCSGPPTDLSQDLGPTPRHHRASVTKTGPVAGVSCPP